MKICFFYLSAFSQTGGLEKFNRCFLKALSENSQSNGHLVEAISMYDADADARYNGSNRFRGHRKQKMKAVMHAVRSAMRSDVFIIGHIHLALAAVLAKKLKPSLRVIFITHGVEVWRKPSKMQQMGLEVADTVLAVSLFTKNQLVHYTGIRAEKIKIFHNTLDPFFQVPKAFHKPAYLQQRYGLSGSEQVVMTLARLSSTEKYKGYDKVLEAVALLKQRQPLVKYMIAGKYDEAEFARITGIAEQLGITDDVILTGFIKDEEITDHYLLGDVFIMPSKKEGFGIVFLEAMACGLPVIGGNQDGTADALKGGELGQMVNVDDVEEMAAAIEAALHNKADDGARRHLQEKIMENFGFDRYSKRLAGITTVVTAINN